MPLKVVCPNVQCRKAYSVGDTSRDRTISCRNCGTAITISATYETLAPDNATNGTGARSVASNDKPVAAGHRQPEKLGRFVIDQRIGEGAFGTVYRALDPLLDRVVALKVLKLSASHTPSAIARFLREPKAAAQLRHPNIVPVYDAGSDGAQHYIASAFIEGETLEAALDAKTDESHFDFRRSAKIVLALAEALYYAHKVGIVHRDVKPANIMLDSVGEPLIMDFGLARIESAADQLTHDGAIMGTPAYMAPEQASRQHGEVGPHSDQYSLGVVFYELLTGERPFTGPVPAVVFAVLNTSPPPPRSIRPAIPLDLETICLKAMSKAPNDRYASCHGLAEDLRRWMQDTPIHARRMGLLERSARWTRRNPLLAGLSAAVLLLAILSSIAAVGLLYSRRVVANALASEKIQSERAQKASEEARIALQRESASLYSSLLGQSAALRTAREPGYRTRVWENLRQAASLDVPERDTVAIRDELTATLGDPFGLSPVQSPVAERAPRPQVPEELAKLAKGRLMTANAEGSMAASVSGSTVNLYDRTGKKASKPSSLGPIHDLLFTPGGDRVLVACEEGLLIWRTADLTQLAAVRGDALLGLAAHPAGHLFATISSVPRIEVWSLDAQRLIVSIKVTGPTKRISFSSDGSLLLGLESKDKVSVGWPVSSTPEKLKLEGHRGGVTGVAFSPDGTKLASSSKDKTVKLWDAQSGKLLNTLRPNEQPVQSVAFSPDGKLLASGDWGGAVRLWDPNSGEMLQKLAAGAPRQIWRVRFDPTGAYLAAIGTSPSVLWRIDPSTRRARKNGRITVRAGGTDVAITSDGSAVIIVGYDERVHRYDRDKGELRLLKFKVGSKILSAHLSADQNLLRYITTAGTIGAWDWAADLDAGKSKSRPRCRFLAMSADDRWAAVRSDSSLVIHDVMDDQEWLMLPAESSAPWCVEWSPDGSKIAAGLSDGGLVVWDVEHIRTQLSAFGIALPSTRAGTLKTPGSSAELSDALRQ